MSAVAPRQLASRLLIWAGAAFVAAVAAQNLVSAVKALNAPFAYQRDFLQVYVLARAVPDRASVLQTVPQLADRYVGVRTTAFPYPVPHPPTAGVIVAPLALLDYRTASDVWLVVQLGCLGISLLLLSRGLGRPWPPARFAGFVALAVAWSPVNTELLWGNYTLILLAALSGVWLGARRGKPALSGILLGLSILIKPLAWPVFLCFLLRREWRCVVPASAVVGLGYLLTGALVGFAGLTSYFVQVVPQITAIDLSSWGNISLAADAWHAFAGAAIQVDPANPERFSVPIIASPGAARAGAAALPALATLGCLWIVRRWRRPDWTVALLICLTVVVNPIAWDNYEVLLIVPIAAVASWLRDHRFPTGPTAASVGIGVTLVIPWWAWPLLATLIAGQAQHAAGAPLPGIAGLLLAGTSLSVVGLTALIGVVGRQCARDQAGLPPGRIGTFWL